jgi:hypothetical protein
MDYVPENSWIALKRYLLEPKHHYNSKISPQFKLKKSYGLVILLSILAIIIHVV